MPGVVEQISGENWNLFRGDCCEVIRDLPDASIDFCIHSPPFSNLYIYSDNEADMGNCQDDAEFIEHYKFLIGELHRSLVTGRLVAVHCKDLPKYANRDDTAGLKDFPGDIIRAFVDDEAAEFYAAMKRLENRRNLAEAENDVTRALKLTDVLSMMEDELADHPAGNSGFSYHSRVTIWKCPVTERERTNNNGLLHKTVKRDRSQLRQGMADYLLLFRKPPVGTLMSDKPVKNKRATGEIGPDLRPVMQDAGFEYYVGPNNLDPRTTNDHPSPYARKTHSQQAVDGSSIDIWRRYAEPVWWDIDQTDVLNYRLGRESQAERHICPLQLCLIERAVQIWSNPGDVVLTPFAGVGSELVGSIRQGRRAVGIELKESYFRRAVADCKEAEEEQRQGRLL